MCWVTSVSPPADLSPSLLQQPVRPVEEPEAPAHSAARIAVEDEHDETGLPAMAAKSRATVDLLLSMRFDAARSPALAGRALHCRLRCLAVRSGSPGAPRPPGGRAPPPGGRRRGARRGRPARPMPRPGARPDESWARASSASASAVSASSSRSCSSSARPRTSRALPISSMRSSRPSSRRSALRACSSAATGSPVRRYTCASDETIVATSSSVPCSSATANASLQPLDRLVGLAEQELEPAEVVEQPADVAAVVQLLVRRLRPLGVRARQHPVPVALGDQRGLEVRLARGAHVVHRLGELERELDVLARRLVVALAAVAARPPGEDARPEEVGRERRPVEQLERLAEERDGGRDARRGGSGRRRAGRAPRRGRRPRTPGLPRERPRLGEQVEPGADLAVVHPRPGLAGRAAAPGARARRSRPPGRAPSRTRRSRPRSRASRSAPRRARAPPRRGRARRSRRRSRGTSCRRRDGPRATRPSPASGASCRARSGRCTPSRTGRPRARTGSFPQRRAAGAADRPGGSRGCSSEMREASVAIGFRQCAAPGPCRAILLNRQW